MQRTISHGVFALVVTAVAGSASAAQVRVQSHPRPQAQVEQATRFTGREVAADPAATAVAREVVRLSGATPPAPPPPLPGTPFATVDADHLAVAGKLWTTAHGVLSTPLDPGKPMFILGNTTSMFAAAPHLRLRITAEAGQYFIVRCRMSPGSYVVKQGAMGVVGPEATRATTPEGDLTFLLDNATAGANTFSIHRPSTWMWYSCEVRQLS